MEYLVDSHTHLTSREFDVDRDDVIARAHAAGVRYMVNPSTTVDDSRKAVALAESHEGIFACAGIHPHEAKTGDAAALRAIEEISRHSRVVAIGEIGLDYHYDFAPRDVQQHVFREQLAIAVRRDLPVVIHTRESEADTIRIVEEAVAAHPDWRNARGTDTGRYPRPRGVFHCFPGDPELAWHVIRLGFAVSLPGIVTFKNPGNAGRVAAEVSAEHFLLETDAPYLTPVPHRGTRNEPSYLPLIAETIAAAQHLTVRDIARATSYGAHLLFGIGEGPGPEIVYRLKNSLYINLTIRCNADCVFCDRKGAAVIKGHNLKIPKEPTVEEVIAQLGDPREVDEIVFCGYGEPTIRLDALKEVARWVKSRGGKTRLNTDGHGSVIAGRNIIPELVGLIDAVSISLNSTDPDQYGQLMRLDGRKFFPAMVEFAREAVKALPRVVMTVVDLDEVDKEKARRLVEEEIGAVFSTRPFF
jgi:TatD DNase family protein